MHRKYFLIVTALAEGATGLFLLIRPSVPLLWLLGVDQAPRELIVAAHIAGAALLAIGVASWFGRSELPGQALRGLITGILIYDVAAAWILAQAGLSLGLVGVALWPAVVLHVALAGWSMACIVRTGSY
jgi:hypothetical protein